MPRRVLITGANGYLGRALVRRAIQDPDVEIEALWHVRNDRLVPDPPPARLRYRRCDLGDPAAVEALFEDASFDAAIHTAALLPDAQPDYLSRATRANVLATARLAEGAAVAGTRRFVYCSSISVYGSAYCPPGGWTEDGSAAPDSVYGWSKLVAEDCVRFACAEAGMNGVSLRMAGIHGGDRRGGALYHLASNALAARPLTVNNAAAPFQLVFIDDAVEAVWRAATVEPPPREIRINVASHLFPSLRAFAEAILDVTASRSQVVTGTPGDGRGDVMDASRQRDVLGCEPPAAQTRLRAYCEELRAIAS
jgi:UDP-glucuronate 4-epimerase